MRWYRDSLVLFRNSVRWLILCAEGKADSEQRGEDIDIESEAVRLLPALQGQDRKTVEEGLAITDFLRRTPTQLTYHGIVLLHQSTASV